MSDGKTGGANSIQALDLGYISGSPPDLLFETFKTSIKGLSEKEAENRLIEYGHNETAKRKRRTLLVQILSKFLNPLVIVLAIIGLFSLFFGEKISAFLVFMMILMSVVLAFIQEHRSEKEAEKLSEMVRTTVTVLRNGKQREVNLREIVPGDIADLYAGDMIPADLRIVSCKDLFINQATLTGESFPVEKFSAPMQPKSHSITELTNIAFMGSSVESGTGYGLVVKTGVATKFGEISKRLAATTIETGFDKGVRDFTWLMIRMMMIMVTFIFVVSIFVRGWNLMEAFLFAIAVAVGLTPEMLPMLVTINLSKGAIAMSKKQVIVRRLHTIQNFGAMDVICTDKTGTLTQDKIILEKHCDVTGKDDEEVLRYAYINSFYQTGLKNLLDRTILKHEKLVLKKYRKIDEMPFDFSRRIMSVVVESEGKHILISKGAPEEVFSRCAKYELNGEVHDMKELLLSDLREERNRLYEEGFRVLAVAYRIVGKKEAYSKEDEKDLVLRGYLAFLDPPKPTAKHTVESLNELGIEVKVLTGDSEIVTKKICSDVDLQVRGIVTGNMIDVMSDKELQEASKNTTIFARLNPIQKERVIHAVRSNNHIVGFLGDGINDAPALKAADIGISVDNAADIAKESADIILLRKSLTVIKDGVLEGRKTFSNIVKYLKMGSSSNFGNMFSMTGGVLFLPFMPMMPIQILLNNFLYDMSQVGIPTDDVDETYLKEPRPWRVDYIKKFMGIGLISSIFDFLTYFVMLFVFNCWANPELFHTGWFLESLTTQTLVIYVIRTGKIPFIESRPSKFLMFTSILILVMAFSIVLSPFAHFFGFVRPPPSYFAILAGMVILYLLMVQVAKSWFIKKYGYG